MSLNNYWCELYSMNRVCDVLIWSVSKLYKKIKAVNALFIFNVYFNDKYRDK